MKRKCGVLLEKSVECVDKMSCCFGTTRTQKIPLGVLLQSPSVSLLPNPFLPPPPMTSHYECIGESRNYEILQSYEQSHDTPHKIFSIFLFSLTSFELRNKTSHSTFTAAAPRVFYLHFSLYAKKNNGHCSDRAWKCCHISIQFHLEINFTY